MPVVLRLGNKVASFKSLLKTYFTGRLSLIHVSSQLDVSISQKNQGKCVLPGTKSSSLYIHENTLEKNDNIKHCDSMK